MYFQIRSRHRAEEVAEVITAACECVLGTDRFRSYDAERFSQMDMQKCMSHIVKNLSEVLGKKRGRARSFCEGLKNSLRQCLRLWQQYHNGESTLNQYEEESFITCGTGRSKIPTTNACSMSLAGTLTKGI